MTTDTTSNRQLAASCTFLANLWLHEVDEQKLELLQSPGIGQIFADFSAEATRELAGTDPTATIDLLAADYCQLLIGPKGHLPPVQSVWAEQVFQAKAAASTHRFYALFPAYAAAGPIVDHLGAQLHFAGHLLASLDTDDGDAIREVLDQFHAKHLTWANPLLARVKAKAETAFYRGLAGATEQLIADLPAR